MIAELSLAVLVMKPTRYLNRIYREWSGVRVYA